MLKIHFFLLKITSQHHQVTGDFIVEDCEVDGVPASQMKCILIRQ